MAASTITYTAKTTTAPQSNFMNQRNDGQHEPIPAANGIQTQDATGTPITSPSAFASASITTLVVPTSAIRFHIIPTTHTINLGEASSLTNYITLLVGLEYKIDCANMANIYLQANTGAATGTSFWFELV